MLSIRTNNELEHALTSLLDPALRRLLVLRRDQLANDGLDIEDIAHIIIICPGDTLAEVEAEAGIPLATDAGDDPECEPPFEYVEQNQGHYEAVLILSDSGYGLILFAPDTFDIDPAITSLLRRHAAA
jgi:hypothetical protein